MTRDTLEIESAVNSSLEGEGDAIVFLTQLIHMVRVVDDTSEEEQARSLIAVGVLLFVITSPP